MDRARCRRRSDGRRRRDPEGDGLRDDRRPSRRGRASTPCSCRCSSTRARDLARAQREHDHDDRDPGRAAARAGGARRRPGGPADRVGDADAARRRHPRCWRALLRLGFVANFISEPVLVGFKAGIGLVIVLDQVPKLLGIHFAKGTFLHNLLAIARGCRRRRWRRSPSALATLGDPGRGRALPAARARAADRGGGRDRRGRPAWPAAYGVETVGQVPPGLPSLHRARPLAGRRALARRARHCADELHRDDCRRARVRAERRAAAASQTGSCSRPVSPTQAGALLGRCPPAAAPRRPR